MTQKNLNGDISIRKPWWPFISLLTLLFYKILFVGRKEGGPLGFCLSGRLPQTLLAFQGFLFTSRITMLLLLPIFFLPCSLYSLSRNHIMFMLIWLMMCHRSLKIYSFFFIFSSFALYWIMSIDLSYSSLVISSA